MLQLLLLEGGSLTFSVPLPLFPGSPLPFRTLVLMEE